MNTTTVSKLRTSEATRVFDQLKAGDEEPIAVLSSSKIIGYLVSAPAWDALHARIKRIAEQNSELHDDLLQAAEDEPPGPFFDNVEDLIADLHA